MTRETDEIKDDVTELRVQQARGEEKLSSLDHRVRNQVMGLESLEKRVARLEGFITWLYRTLMALATSSVGIAYAWLRKTGVV